MVFHKIWILKHTIKNYTIIHYTCYFPALNFNLNKCNNGVVFNHMTTDAAAAPISVSKSK